MFELSVAFKYLVPRFRQLSVSIISLISILVIALVVWLITVFFSVTLGLEKSWVQKLIALTAPVRISPTPHYYSSYYYLIDSISQESNYTEKSIGEKLQATITDPYDPDMDQEVPHHWPRPELDASGHLIDPVKLAFGEIGKIRGIPHLSANEYEMTLATIKIKQIRDKKTPLYLREEKDDQAHSMISQATYLGSYDPENPNLAKAGLKLTPEDVRNLIAMAWVDTGFHFGQEEQYQEDEDAEGTPPQPTAVEPLFAKNRLNEIFKRIRITSFKTSSGGLSLPLSTLPDPCRINVCALKVGRKIHTIFIPQNSESLRQFSNGTFNERTQPLEAELINNQGKSVIALSSGEEIDLSKETLLSIDGGQTLHVKFDPKSLQGAKRMSDLRFDFRLNLQGIDLTGSVSWDKLELASFELEPEQDAGPFWAFEGKLPPSLPSDSLIGDAILLPKSYRTAGALVGDRGHLVYQAPTASAMQEQRVPIYVAGFYDPGILPLGGKIILANQNVTSMIRSSYPTDQSSLSNGINVRFEDLDDTEKVKSAIESGFKRAGIDAFWKVETFREFEFTKDFLQQLRSERNLFSLISVIVIIVACSNIVSMLIILVNNKKMEIGILRSMGASSFSIACIFGTCGIVMGLAGSLLGLAAALLTLKNLSFLIDLISKAQGFDMFNPVFYGDSLPNQISAEALIFVMTATVLVSLIAGVVPAIKACFMRPSAILRSE